MAKKIVDSSALSSFASALKSKILDLLLDKADLDNNIIKADQVPSAVLKITEIIEEEEDEETGEMHWPEFKYETFSAGGEFDILYHPGLNTFIARKPAANQLSKPTYHKTFQGCQDYVTAPGEEPRKDVIFYQVKMHTTLKRSYVDMYVAKQGGISCFFSSMNAVLDAKQALDAISQVYTKSESDGRFIKSADISYMTAAEATAAVNTAFA